MSLQDSEQKKQDILARLQDLDDAIEFQSNQWQMELVHIIRDFKTLGF